MLLTAHRSIYKIITDGSVYKMTKGILVNLQNSQFMYKGTGKCIKNIKGQVG